MLGRIKEPVKWLMRTVLGEYSAYYVYASPSSGSPLPETEPQTPFEVRAIDVTTIRSSTEPLVREQAGYLGAEAHAYACMLDDRIAAVCIYWFGERYRTRNFWPLDEGEAKLIQIVTVPASRGRGAATSLIASSFRDMRNRGFHRAYARVWHSNVPSLRAFERAGWTRIALVLEINPLRRRRPLRFRFDAS